jgi:hypothetical protein
MWTRWGWFESEMLVSTYLLALPPKTEFLVLVGELPITNANKKPVELPPMEETLRSAFITYYIKR